MQAVKRLDVILLVSQGGNGVPRSYAHRLPTERNNRDCDCSDERDQVGRPGLICGVGKSRKPGCPRLRDERDGITLLKSNVPEMSVGR